MSIFRSFLLIVMVTMFVSTGLFIFGYSMGYNQFNGGYAVLSTCISVDDKQVSMLIDNASFLDGAPVSESSLWVMLDNFNSLEVIPLDTYFSRIYYFDPRNDGYAEKLQSIFIRDNERFFYVPVRAGNWNPAFLDKQFASLLPEIPFSVEYYGVGRPVNFFFLLYFLSCLCFLIVYFIGKKSFSRSKPNFALCNIVLFPVFSSFAFFGAEGIACASIFFAFFILWKDPLGEIITKKWSILKRGQPKKSWGKLIFKEVISPYRYYIYLLPVFIAAFTIMVIFSQIKPLFLLAVFSAALFVYLFSIKLMLISYGKRKRFIPVLIKKRHIPDYSFSFFILPFAASVFFILVLAPYQSRTLVPNRLDVLIEEKDYFSHLTFQYTFSTRPLFSANNKLSAASGFPAFFIGSDGLPSMRMSQDEQMVDFSDFPPFPVQLEQLMDFFHNTGKNNTNNFETNVNMEIFSLIILILFIIPGFVIKRKIGYSIKADFFGSKRISREFHLNGINRNKTLLYNERNPKRNQGGSIHQKKDA